MTYTLHVPDTKAAALAKKRLDSLAMPRHSLGQFEQLLIKIAAIQGTPDISLTPRSVLIFCGDHGVVEENVTQCSSDVTHTVALSIAQGESTITVMARAAHADVHVIDMGMTQPAPPPVIDRRQNSGTKNFTKAPAMTRAEAEASIECGIDLVLERAKTDRILSIGEMGIGNTTSASALTAVLLGKPVREVTGYGSGLSEDGLKRKIEVIQKAIQLHHPDPGDPIGVLAALGGFEIAGMVGACIGAAVACIPVIIDGMIASAAALTALRIEPDIRPFLLPSHMSAAPAAPAIMDAMGFSPIIHAGMHLGEGTGAVLLFPLLDMVKCVYDSSHTFDSLHMDPYPFFGGNT